MMNKKAAFLLKTEDNFKKLVLKGEMEGNGSGTSRRSWPKNEFTDLLVYRSLPEIFVENLYKYQLCVSTVEALCQMVSFVNRLSEVGFTKTCAYFGTDSENDHIYHYHSELFKLRRWSSVNYQAFLSSIGLIQFVLSSLT